MKPYIALAVPSRRKVRRDYMTGMAAMASQKCGLMPIGATSSLLNLTFNMLWCFLHNFIAEGHPFTDVAILHDDIEPDPLWIDTLYEEREAVGADMITAHSPIKTEQGIVSLATYQDDIWDFNRFTVRQLLKMPETFTQEEAGGNLLLNTGCCLLRLRGPWLERPEDFVFQDWNRVARDHDGKLVPQVISEDWRFSDAIRIAGGKLAATRKVALAHEGTKDYRNDRPWGAWERDASYLKRHENDHENQIPEGLRISPEREVAVA